VIEATMKPRRRSIALGAATGLCVLIAGCGGDSDSGSSGSSTERAPVAGGEVRSPAPRPSKAEFIKQADKICKDTHDKIVDLGSPRDATDLDQYLDRLAKVTSDMNARLKKVTPPAEAASDFDRYQALWATAAKRVQQMGVAAQARDMSKLKALQKDFEATSSDATTVATRIGLTGGCGSAN
jgi:hypothetical protein